MLNMKDISRSGHVTRWHSVRTARAQTLAEHQYLVTMYAREIAHRLFHGGLAAMDELALVNYTLRHDTPELLMGDIPTPVKARIAKRCEGINNPLVELELEICPLYRAAKNAVADTPLEAVAKLADITDAIVFLSAEKTNSHGEFILRKLHRMFEAKIALYERTFPALTWSVAFNVLIEARDGVDHQIEFE